MGVDLSEGVFAVFCFSCFRFQLFYGPNLSKITH